MENRLIINLPIDETFETELEQACQKIEKASLILNSLFRCMSAVSELSQEQGGFEDDMVQLSEVGSGLSMSIFHLVAALFNFVPNKQSSLAFLITQLLEHHELPSDLRDGILEGLTDIANASGQTRLKEMEVSLSYIQLILDDYKEHEND